MQNKILIAIIIALLGIILVNSAFKNGKSVGGKEYVTIVINPQYRNINVSSTTGEHKNIKIDKSLNSADFSPGLKLVSEYEAKGFKIINSSFYPLQAGAIGEELGILMEKE